MRLNGTREAIESQEYPVTSERLTEECGDCEIELIDGEETLGDCLDRLGPETFETPEQVRLSLFSAVSGKAVGRRHYSDRDPPTLEETSGQVSF